MPSFGRIPVLCDDVTITSENVVQVLRDALAVHSRNAMEIHHLRDVYRGRQKILGREKQVRPEINNKVVANHANEIVSFKVSYLLSEPIIYINRGDAASSDGVSRLNEYMYLESKAASDREIADDFNTTGVAYRLVLPNRGWTKKVEDEAPFKVYTLDPELTFVIRARTLGFPVVAGVTMMIDKAGVATFSVYTDSAMYTIRNEQILRTERHALGQVPIVEYVNNSQRIGSFEIVETLLDAINALESNRLDATEQVVQALMIFKNCDIDAEGLEQLRQSGAIKLVSNGTTDSDIQMLTADLKQTDQQVLLDSLYKTVRLITGMPYVSEGGTSDSSNNGATFMRNGWFSADARAKDDELLWRRSENEMLRVVLKILRGMTDIKLSLGDIGVKFTRRNYEDIYSKANTLLLLLQSGIHPSYAIAQCGLFGDPVEVYSASEEYLEKWVVASKNAVTAADMAEDDGLDDADQTDDNQPAEPEEQDTTPSATRGTDKRVRAAINSTGKGDK